jgi:hypothetical protein
MRRCEDPARFDPRNAFEVVLFVSRLEMASMFCFVWVTAISNCFGVPVRIGRIAASARALTVAYMYCLAIVQRYDNRRLAGRQERML